MVTKDIRFLERETPVSFLGMPRIWRTFPQGVYDCKVLLVPDEDGGFSAIMPHLPGTSSQGETEAEALANIKEAFRGVARVYLEQGGTIPWSQPDLEDKPQGSRERWILVDV